MAETTSDNSSLGDSIDLSQFYQVFFEEAGENLENMEQKLLELTKAALRAHALRPVVHLAQALHARRQPCKTMGAMLRLIDAARFLDLDAHAGLGCEQDLVSARNRLAAPFDKARRPRRKDRRTCFELCDGH